MVIKIVNPRKEYLQEYNRKNKEKIKSYKKDYYQKNKEKLKKYKANYMNIPSNKKKIRESDKIYRKKNQDKLLKNHREYNQKNKENINLKSRERFKKPEIKLKKKLYYRKWYKKNKEGKIRKYYKKNKQKENVKRKKLGLPLIGDGYFYQESRLFLFISKLFPTEEIIRRNRKILGLELDIYLPNLKLAFEFQGYHHFVYPNHFHKTKEQFELNQWKDKRKKELCKEEGIILIEITEFEELSEQLIIKKLNENNIQTNQVTLNEKLSEQLILQKLK